MVFKEDPGNESWRSQVRISFGRITSDPLGAYDIKFCVQEHFLPARVKPTGIRFYIKGLQKNATLNGVFPAELRQNIFFSAREGDCVKVMREQSA